MTDLQSKATKEAASAASKPLPRLHRDLIVGVVILTVCAGLFWETTQFPPVPPMLSQNISAAFFPRILIAAVSALTIAMMISGWREQGRAVRLHFGTVATGIAVVAGIASIAFIGVLPAIFLLSGGLPLLWGERRLARVGIYAVCVPIGIYVLFTLVLRVRFPLGMF